MRQTLADLINFANIVKVGFQLTASPCEALDIATAAYEAIRDAAEEKGVAIEILLDPAVNTVIADPVRLQQALLNLLFNSIKFTPAGGVIVFEIKREDDDSIAFSVSDSGEGMSAEFRPKLFENFTQETPTDSNVSNLGLGLAIVKEIVKLHAGKLSAFSSGKGKGATFKFTLPLTRSLAGAQLDSCKNRSDRRKKLSQTYTW